MGAKARVRTVLVALAVAASPLVTSRASEAAVLPLVEVTCGETVGDDPEEQKSFRLKNNMECTGDGMVITADDITIDLDGRRVSGDDAGGDQGDVGFHLGGVSSNVTIQNGYASGFDIGVHVDNSNSHTIKKLTVVDNEIDSVRIAGFGNAVLKNAFLRGSEVRLLEDGAAQSDNTRIEGNTFVRDGIFVSGADTSSIRNNTLRAAGTIDVVDGDPAAAGANDNVISGNTIIAGDSSGITVSGDASDGNEIVGNTIRGSGEDGIEVAHADATRIVGNVSTGNPANGIEVGGSATGGLLKGNDASANVNNGIVTGSATTFDRVVSNVARENGENGIDIQSTTGTTVEGNTAKFNGFINGLADDGDFGIEVAVALTPVDPKNVANGNDVGVPAESQCSPAFLCDPPGNPAADPLLITCNTTFATAGESHTLRHPLNCGGDALTVAAQFVKLKLGLHHVSGGTTVGDASVEVTGAGNDGLVSGGMLLDSANGLRMGGFGGAVTDVTVARSADEGVIVTGDGDVLTRLTSIANGAPGAQLTGADGTKIKASDLSGNGSIGLAVSGGAQNTVSGSRLSGNFSTGTSLLDTNTNTFLRNAVIGNAVSGILLGGTSTGADANRIEENVVAVNANDLTGFDGISVGIGIGGFDSNLILKNTSTANEGNGIEISNATGNVVRGNKVLANKLNGVGTNPGVTATNVASNAAHKNGVHGITVAQAANVTAIKGNTGNANGLTVVDGTGLGVFAPVGTPGCGNKGKGNDDTDQIEPPELKEAC